MELLAQKGLLPNLPPSSVEAVVWAMEEELRPQVTRVEPSTRTTHYP